MAEKPIKTPLPADLPEDWNAGQIVAPDGTAVGLTEQHGYNYLMAAVNRAQRGVNEVNDAFETVSGKRTCRFVVGTSAAGWTEADCDYLCDGTDDQAEIQQAINALLEGGGEIVLLSGNYQLSADVGIAGNIGNLSITGEPGGTILCGGRITTDNSQPPVEFYISGIVFKKSSVSAYNTYLSVKNCSFENSKVYFYQTKSDIPGEFLCIGNRFLLNDASAESTQIYCFNSTITPNTNIVISNNTIITNEVLASRSILIRVAGPSDGGGLYTISGNVIRCISKCYLFLQVPGTIANNSFHNCDVDLYVGGNLVGNKFFDCDASVDAATLNTYDIRMCASVSGNTLENGTISACGNVGVTGNVVNAGSTEKEYAIQLIKTASNAAEDQFPAVVGNYVANGKCGILLKEPNFTGGNNNCKNAMVNSNRIYGSQTPIKIGRYWSGCMVTDNLFTTGAIEDNGTDNIVRFNSDDTSGGGSTPATVQQATPTITVNADGTVTARATQTAGYVAAGTRSATHQLTAADDTDLAPENIKDGVSIFGVTGTLQSGGGVAGVESFNGRSGAVMPQANDYSASDVGAVAASAIKDILAMTQTEYDNLTTKDPTVLYMIKE